jgi:hypothetical protein
VQLLLANTEVADGNEVEGRHRSSPKTSR